MDWIVLHKISIYLIKNQFQVYAERAKKLNEEKEREEREGKRQENERIRLTPQVPAPAPSPGPPAAVMAR